ncbi:MAG TPA: cellulase family glycosylhydrolase [Polyangiaceae bacterium]
MPRETLRRALYGAALTLLSCGEWQVSEGPVNGGGGSGPEPTACAIDTTAVAPSAAPRGLHVVGNELRDGSDQRLVLRGVNRSGSEYTCMRAQGFFDGPGFGDGAEESVRAMAAWNINAVRVPLNESCWLSIGGAPVNFSGENYKAAIVAYVELLQRYGLVPILELHRAAPGNLPAEELQPMPNADNTPRFWTDVAETFADNSGVIFELYNEPFPDFNRDTAAAWSCWRDGCEVSRAGIDPGDTAPRTYMAAGMQSLVDAVRDAGSSHVILLGGVQYSNALTRFLEYVPDDPLQQLGAAWHVYNFNACRDASCYEGVPAAVAREFLVVATEVGQNDCEGEAFLSPLLDFLEANAIGRLAWSWNAFGACTPEDRRLHTGQPWSLVQSYTCPEPNGDYAQIFYDHLESLRQERTW